MPIGRWKKGIADETEPASEARAKAVANFQDALLHQAEAFRLKRGESQITDGLIREANEILLNSKAAPLWRKLLGTLLELASVFVASVVLLWLKDLIMRTEPAVSDMACFGCFALAALLRISATAVSSNK